MPTVAHAFDDELARLDGTATAAAVRARELSPVEVVQAAVARAERLGDVLGAVAATDYRRAVRSAAGRRSGAFAGVPTFVKDNSDVAGLPTRHGTAALAGAAAARRTDELVEQLLSTGMVVLGKSTMPEFGFTPSCERAGGPTTRNPWDLDRSAGGSSSGSAALVAAGVVPVAHGADGGGSIRIPAAACGLVGMKPTRGRLVLGPDSRNLPVDIVAEGLLTRTVRDTARFLAQAERRHRDPRLPPVGEVTEPLRRRLRVGVVAESPTGVVLDAPTRTALDATVDLLDGLGHRCEPVSLPDGERFAEDFRHYWAMLVFSVELAGNRLYHRSFDRTVLTPFTTGMAASFRRSVWRTPANLVRMRRAEQRYRHLFDDHDVLVSPTVATLPPPIGFLDEGLPFDVLMERIETWVAFTPLANATGTPSVSLPLGHDGASGLPVGVMFSAATGEEALLLELALELEAAHPFRTLADQG